MGYCLGSGCGMAGSGVEWNGMEWKEILVVYCATVNPSSLSRPPATVGQYSSYLSYLASGSCCCALA